jgi:hypothetical protein
MMWIDKTGNGGTYTGSTDQAISNPGAIAGYFEAISKGVAPPDFVLCVPKQYGLTGSGKIPNVQGTDDPAKIFTAHFRNGQEIG